MAKLPYWMKIERQYVGTDGKWYMDVKIRWWYWVYAWCLIKWQNFRLR